MSFTSIKKKKKTSVFLFTSYPSVTDGISTFKIMNQFLHGDFYPCEKLIECPNLSIGNIESGLNIQKIVDFLNIGKSTEADCKHCWAMRFCEMCIAQCFDPEQGNITVEAKRISCDKQKQKTLYFFKKLIEEKYHKNSRR